MQQHKTRNTSHPHPKSNDIHTKILVIKISSMGDLIHTLPAITDAAHAIPNAQFTWVTEEAFTEIPTWHPNVQKVIPIALRRWRKAIGRTIQQGEWQLFYQTLRATHYDYAIDAQGLLKSACIARLAQSHTVGGPDVYSARESWAALVYQQRFSIPKQQHAITRTRQLFSLAFNYPLPDTTPNYGIDLTRFQQNQPNTNKKTIVFIHGSSRHIKCWPESHWITLGHLANRAGFTIHLPWGNQTEAKRAKRIANACQSAHVLDKLNLQGLAGILSNADAVVTVDTGPGHLAAALNRPTVGLYGPTNPALCGIRTHNGINLYDSNGLDHITAEDVWQAITKLLTKVKKKRNSQGVIESR